MDVRLHASKAEFLAFERGVQTELLAVAKLLAEFGPRLGRPYVDTLKGSKHANMKEMRFSAADGEWHAAFAFDPERNGIVMIAGDKSGSGHKRFDKQLIAKADSRFSDHPENLKSLKKGDPMGRSIDQDIASLPHDQQDQIEARFHELQQEVEGLRELRQIAGKAQEDVATALNIRQPSVSKIENQADMYLSTLRSYVEAIGGKLELTVKLPARPRVRIEHLGDLTQPAVKPSARRASSRRRLA